MKKKHLRQGLAALCLAAVLAFTGLPARAASPAEAQLPAGLIPTETAWIEENVPAPAADTIGGACTALVTERDIRLDGEEENAALLGAFVSSDRIRVSSLRIKNNNTVLHNYEMDLVECLMGITYTEMGAVNTYSFVSAKQAKEVWQAQAIAIHSYILYQTTYGDSGTALIYTPVEKIPAATRQALREAIEPVKNQILVYGSGKDTANYSVCNAVFSCSAGYNTSTRRYGTCDSENAWGRAIPYLKSVESRYEKQYHEKMLGAVGKPYEYLEYTDSRHPGEAYFSADTSQKDKGGFVKAGTLVVNGRAYARISDYVTARYCFNYEKREKRMHYYGFGHGVGMSQCGAVGYAVEEGYTCNRILQKYYTDASLLDTSTQRITSLRGGLSFGLGGGLLQRILDALRSMFR